MHLCQFSLTKIQQKLIKDMLPLGLLLSRVSFTWLSQLWRVSYCHVVLHSPLSLRTMVERGLCKRVLRWVRRGVPQAVLRSPFKPTKNGRAGPIQSQKRENSSVSISVHTGDGSSYVTSKDSSSSSSRSEKSSENKNDEQSPKKKACRNLYYD
jgi:hypothetical protein